VRLACVQPGNRQDPGFPGQGGYRVADLPDPAPDVASQEEDRVLRAVRTQRDGSWPTTRFVRAPIPSISTVTVSPGFRGPTPAGVPVAITSPG